MSGLYGVKERTYLLADVAWRLEPGWKLPSSRDGGLALLDAPSADMPVTYLPSPPPARLSPIDGVEVAVADGVALPFDTWTEVNNSREGRFLERFQTGAFRDTLRPENRKNPIVAMLDHGQDPVVGAKPLGRMSVWETRDSLRFQLAFLDVDYARNAMVAARAGLLGASVRFGTIRDQVERRPARSSFNPAGLEQRTVTAARLTEISLTALPCYPNTRVAVAA